MLALVATSSWALDTMVWLPEKNVLFAGDIVYVDRLLAIIAVSNTQ